MSTTSSKTKRRSVKRNACKASCSLCKTFAEQATTHGLRRIADSRGKLRKLVWSIIFLAALSGCLYHCSFIIMRYLAYPTVTSTEEVHAPELEFPGLTVCNLNILKKGFLDDQLTKNKLVNGSFTKGFCFVSEEEFLKQSNAKDLSDVWSKLGITSQHLKDFGHKVYDLIVQCTYNNKDCFNQSITSTLPLKTENITISDYISSRLGFCYTILLNKTTLGRVRRAGQTRGLTLTLNIERDEYLNLLSPEYGVRLMVHPRNSYPSIERGSIVLHPGTKTYVSLRIRQIERLPQPYGDCSKNFMDSPMSKLLEDLDPDFSLRYSYYTYEYCQALCRELMLYQRCQCVEERLDARHKFCNPCDSDQDKCRNEFSAEFLSDENLCTQYCKPACEDVRYDITLSTSEWPNMEYQHYVLDRWTELIPDFTDNSKPAYTRDGRVALNETYINKNFLRVHVYLAEMNYLHFKDIASYKMPEMFADLGGCLGLYIGASVISIIELLELSSGIAALFYDKVHYVFSFRAKHLATAPNSGASNQMHFRALQHEFGDHNTKRFPLSGSVSPRPFTASRAGYWIPSKAQDKDWKTAYRSTMQRC